MSTPLDSLVGELHITAGARQSTTPATGVFTAPRRAARGRADDTLYVLIDLNGDTASSILGDLMRRITDTYWSSPGSVTNALRAAMGAGGEWLMDRNTTAPVAERLQSGVTCAVLRGSNVVIAQAGPAGAYVTQRGSVEVYPARDAEPMPPLGMSRSVEVRFAHAELQPGDVLLLTDARTMTTLPIESIASAIVKVGVEEVLRNLERLAGRGDLIALVIEAAMPEASAPIVPPSIKPERSPLAPASRLRPQPPAESAPIVRSTPAPAPTAKTRIDSSDATPAPPTESRRATARAWLGALIQGLKRGAGSMGTAGQALMQRTLPEPTTPRQRRAASSLEKTPIMAGLAIGIPIIVSLFVVTIYIQRSGQAEVESLSITVQNEITAANQATGTAARVHWQNVISYTSQMLSIASDNATAADQSAQAQAAIDKIDNIVRLQPQLLWDFKSIGQQRLAMNGFSLFVLDRATNQVERLTLAAGGDSIEGNGPEHLLVPGTSINNQVPGNLLDMVWMNSSDKRQASDLIVLHQNGLIDYNLTFGWQALDFGSNKVPANEKRLRGFNGNLYMLDPGAGQVWRYAPRGDGYADAPEAYFAKPVSSTAKAIDIAIDGSIYVLGSDGQLAKYLGGEPATFQIGGLVEPLRQPSVVAVDGNVTDSSLYVADQATGRVVQFRPDGKFVRQFRATGVALDAISDMLIDEQNNRLFVISRGALYTMSLPPIQ